MACLYYYRYITKFKEMGNQTEITSGISQNSCTLNHVTLSTGIQITKALSHTLHSNTYADILEDFETKGFNSPLILQRLRRKYHRSVTEERQTFKVQVPSENHASLVWVWYRYKMEHN